MNQTLVQLGNAGLIPVIKIEDAAKAVPLAGALIRGGLAVAEVTFRTACAPEAIAAIAKEYPDMLVGAGTVLSVEQVKKAVDSGSKYIVAPGFNPRVVEYCVKNSIPVTPGCSTPSDMEAAIELGLDVVKFFPAEPSGGLAMLKALSAPYSQLKFIPTGGIDEKNLQSYLAFDKILACGGSFMVKDDYIKSGDFDKIEELTAKAVLLVQGFGLGHIGINSEGNDDAVRDAKIISAMFGLTVKDGNSSTFAGELIEFMKGNGRGEKGHIAISTLSCERAVAYLAKMGIEMDESSIKMNAKGSINAIYCKELFCGFGLHLLRRA